LTAQARSLVAIGGVRPSASGEQLHIFIDWRTWMADLETGRL